MCICMSVCVSTVPSEARRRASGPLKLELQVTVSHLAWLLGIKLGLLKEQVLLTSSAIPPTSTVFWCGGKMNTLNSQIFMV